MHAATAFFGTRKQEFGLTATFVPPGSPPGTPAITVTRPYERYTDVVDDTIDARVWLGIHFRSSDEDGAWLGKKVARWLDKHYLEPVDDDDDDERRRLTESTDSWGRAAASRRGPSWCRRNRRGARDRAPRPAAQNEHACDVRCDVHAGSGCQPPPREASTHSRRVTAPRCVGGCCGHPGGEGCFVARVPLHAATVPDWVCSEPIAPTKPVGTELPFVGPVTHDLSLSGYRPGSPIAFTSRRYARDLAEVQ